MVNFIEKFGERPEREANSFYKWNWGIEAILGSSLGKSVIKYISLIFSRVNWSSWFGIIVHSVCILSLDPTRFFPALISLK